MKIPNFSRLRPSPPFKDSTYTVICYLPTLWVLVRERAPCGKISGGSRKYRKGVDHRKGGSTRKGGLKSGVQSLENLEKSGNLLKESQIILKLYFVIRNNAFSYWKIHQAYLESKIGLESLEKSGKNAPVEFRQSLMLNGSGAIWRN